ncbi:MAG: hypothetical protein QM765_30960 [Myxococcales bacterium]
MSAPRDLVLSMAGGYDAAALSPLVRSLRETGFAGELRLLLNRNPPGTAEALRELGATCLEVELPGVPETWSYNVERYRLFAGELAASDAERVLLCDSRDVVFQREPLAAFAAEAVHLFEEHPSKPIAKCIWSQAWLRYRYGDAALPPVADKPVLCSGVVVGGLRRMREFVALVAGEVLPSLQATHYMAGYDQGIVNHLAYAGRIPGLVVHPWATALVRHLGNAPAGETRLDAQGRVLTPAGEIAVAVHQHDRHPELREAPDGYCALMRRARYRPTSAPSGSPQGPTRLS